MIRKAPFFGRGLGFPFRIDPSTGGLQMTEGSADPGSAALELMPDNWTIREDVPRDPANHIAEAIAHIVLTIQGEHDTLPEFGSRVNEIIFDPNHFVTAALFETWLEVAVKRWEKRAWVPIPEGVQWNPTGPAIDRGELPALIRPAFLTTQVEGNLVSPFVTPRRAREQEYPVGDPDPVGHDTASRYYDAPTITEPDGTQWTRPAFGKPIETRYDDQFEEAGSIDTWLLASWRLYGDVRFWWVTAEMAIEDAAARGESRDVMDTCGDPEQGTLLRAPSRTRLLMELAA